MQLHRRHFVLTLACALLPVASLPGAEFPPITDAERALTQVPFEPEANAVILFQKAELTFMDYPREISSFLDVKVRIKILSEEGMEFGEIQLPHSKFYRLKSFNGRTVLPDGRSILMGEDSIFREERSRSDRTFVTKAAFPAVEVGAILDYNYIMRWDSILNLEPYLFSNTIPTLHAEIIYDKPDNLGLKPWGVVVGNENFAIDSERGPHGTRYTISLNNLHGIPDEPASFPFFDLSSRFMMIPGQVMVQGTAVDLMKDWKGVCKTFENQIYGQPRKKSRKVKKEAERLITGLNDDRAKAGALFEFVRDQIQTGADAGLYGVADSGLDEVLSNRIGSPAEKALMLQVMLETAKLNPSLVWASDRNTGRADLTVANPWWFDRVMVSFELAGKRVFLDPSDRRLGFAKHSPQVGGSQALLVDRKEPTVLDLPYRTFASNTRIARLDLKVDEAGRIAGQGTYSLSGYPAFYKLRWRDSEEETAEAWNEWLANNYEGFEIGEVKVSEHLDEQWVEVAWSMAQRDEAVLGDEVSLLPSRPLGPLNQRFSLTPEERKTPVLLGFADRDKSELTLTWPEGWEVDVLPEASEIKNAIGTVAYTLQVDAEARSLTYTRRFDTRRTEITGSEGYQALRALYAEAEKHDAQTLALLRP